jgi:5'-nucleotidase/UDP-sugar diphosphatase
MLNMYNKLIKKKIFYLLVIISFIKPINIYPEEKITVLYTNSLNGYLDDCRCKDNPRGGLVMRAEEIKNIRNTYKNIFLFETGDFFAPESDDLTANYIIKGYKYIDYDAVSIGDQEFSGGFNVFNKYSQELPYICNNLLIRVDKSWKPVFDRYRIIVKNNIKIGVIGTIAENAFKYYPKNIIDQIKVIDQKKEIIKDIDSLKSQGIKHIFLLSHSGYETDIELAKNIIGLDLIVGGHSQTLLKKPQKIGDTIIVQAGVDGARIGILELALLDNSVKIINSSFRLPHLPNDKEDKNIRKLIDEYNAEVKKNYDKLKFK